MSVNTMPRETIDALQDHGQIASTLEQGVDDAHRTLDRFAKAGVDYQEVVDVLEREGMQKFADSCKELFEGVFAGSGGRSSGS
jgi:transaldolase